MGMADEMRSMFVDEETSAKFEQRLQTNLARRNKGPVQNVLNDMAASTVPLLRDVMRARMYGTEAEVAGRNVARNVEQVSTTRTRTVLLDEQPQADDDGMER